MKQSFYAVFFVLFVVACGGRVERGWADSEGTDGVDGRPFDPCADAEESACICVNDAGEYIGFGPITCDGPDGPECSCDPDDLIDPFDDEPAGTGGSSSTGGVYATGGFVSTGGYPPSSGGNAGDVAEDSDLYVALSPDTPPGRVISRNAKSVQLLKLDLTAGDEGALITQLLFLRTGTGTATDVQNMFLYDEDGVRLSVGRAVNPDDDSFSFPGLEIVIPAGQTRSVYVYADFDAPAPSVGAMHAVKTLGITCQSPHGSCLISGGPVTGNAFTLADIAVASVDVQAGDVSRNPTSGEQGAEISNFHLTARTHGVNLSQVNVYQAGSVNNSDLTNVELYLGETLLATADAVDQYNLITLVLDTPVAIAEGTDAELSLHADVSGPAGRTIRTYMEYPTDLTAIDATYGVNAQVCIEATDSCNGSFNGDTASGNYVEVTVEEADPSTDSQTCTLDQVRDLGPSKSHSNLAGSPNGYLFAWQEEWETDAHTQAFDPNGLPLSEEVILEDSSNGIPTILGSEDGYLLHAKGSEQKLARFNVEGFLTASQEIMVTELRTTLFATIASGTPQEVLVTSEFFITAEGVRTERFLLYHVHPDVTQELIGEVVLDQLDPEESIRVDKVAQIGDIIGMGIPRSFNDGTRELLFYLYDTSDSSVRSVTISELNTNFEFLQRIQTSGDDFLVIWGANALDDGSYRRETRVSKDGLLGSTRDIPLDPFGGDFAVDGDNVVEGVYDSETYERSFRVYSLTGQLETVLPLPSGRGYYLGNPRVATAGKGNYAVSWTSEDSETFETRLMVAFITCE